MDPRARSLWKLPRGVLAYVLVIDAAAVVVVATTLTLTPIADAQLWFWVLAAGSVIHLEASRRIERLREIAAEGSPHVHLQSVWLFAGLLMLPPPLLAALIAISYTHAWLRVYRRRSLLYRKVFSACTVVLGCTAAWVLLAAALGAPEGTFVRYLDGPRGLLAVVAAGAAYWLVNYALVVGAIVATNPGRPWRAALGSPSDQLIIGAAVGLGTAIAYGLWTGSWLTPVLMITLLALHFGLLLPQFRAASRIDSKTGLVDSTFWREMADKELVRAQRLGSGLGVLLIDLDYFKNVNDRFGHLAGDQVLRAASAALKSQVRSYDLVGRFGGEEFAILLPGAGLAELQQAAERIRLAIRQLIVFTATTLNGNRAIGGLTASVGGAVYPESADELAHLLLAADAALYRAKARGRDQVCIAQPPHDDDADQPVPRPSA
jgi:diguanylate cyclase (GGDEF)-like protein